MVALVSSSCCNRTPQTGCLKQWIFISYSFGAGKFRGQGAAWSGSREDPLPGLQTASFSLCPHTAEGEPAPVPLSPYKNTDPIMGTPPL